MCRPNDCPDLASEELNKQQLAMQSEKERGRGGGRKHPFAMDVSLKSNPYLDDDEMVTWLHIEDALDRSYCSELFGELPRAHHLSKDSFLNDQASMMMMMRDGDTTRTTSEAAMAMGVGRAAGLLPQAGADAFNRVRTSAHHPRATASCSELAFPSPLKTTPSQQQHLRPSLSNLPSPASPKTSFHLPSINIDRARQPFASPGKEAFNPCVQSKATSTTGIASSRLPDFFPHGRDQSQQETGCSLLPTFPLKQDVNAAKEKVEHCHRDASSLSGSAITASEKGTASLQTFDVSPSWGSDVSTEKSAKEGSASSPKKKTRPAEESEYQSEDGEEAAVDAKKPPSGRSSLTKRARAAEIHNLSERKRRDKINLRMKALQELIPNANKTDKASVLDEAIEYLKMLQAQLQFMSMRTGMVVPPTMMPPGMQYLPMQQVLAFPHMGMGMGTGIGLGMGMGIGMSAADAAGAGVGAGAGPSIVSLPPLHGQSLSGPAYYPSEFQPSSSSSVIDEAQDDLQNSHLNEPYNAFPAQQQQQPMHLSTQTNADMYSTFIQLQQQTQENGGSKGIQ